MRARATRHRPPEGENLSKAFAVGFGVFYIAIGLIGFAVTGFEGFTADTDEQLLGLDLNVFHNIVHVAIGLGLVLAATARDETVTQGVVIGVGLFYAVAALLGFLDYLQIISINGHLSLDNFLHLFSALAALGFGLFAAQRQHRSLAESGSLEETGSLPRASAARGAREPLPLEERRQMWER